MLDKHFDYSQREAEIYRMWEDEGVFQMEKCADQSAPVFNITMPPPNANGELHLGHSYGYTVMDTLGRFHRLLGERVLLLPGKDHAGIQTQVVFERKLREEGEDVESMDREEFYKRCYDFCINRADYMRAQEKMLGVSADWSKEVFTLDPDVSRTVYDTFKKLYDDGLVYRGSRIVHWSVFSQTAISDVEVEYKEENGHLWHIAYAIVDDAEAVEPARRSLEDAGGELMNSQNAEKALIGGDSELKYGEIIVREDEAWIIHDIRSVAADDEDAMKGLADNVREKVIKQAAASGEAVSVVLMVPVLERSDAIVVATTRPETMLGDSAIAVHPNDPRYAHMLGAKVTIPVEEREIAIVADDRVDISYGTGAVKVTPAHDFLDYDIGKTHSLEEIQVIDRYGKMTDRVPEKFRGMETLKCREELVKDLEASGELLKVEKMKHKVPIAERGKDVIEPLISEQWFVDVDQEGNSLKKHALELVQSGRINIYPENARKLFEQWLTNLRDWNISRQILWGHRMPVWYRGDEMHIGAEAPEGEGWTQETDTFDTWFSSGQWPYSTLAKHGLLDVDDETKSDHFPTHTMQMGRDILFFWACRMLLFAAYRMHDVPWKNIYFTGLIRDEHGQKMSKSKGNGVEPNEMIQKYGIDALRMSFIAGNKAGQDVKFSEKKVEGYSKFVNKLWNAAKLVEMKLEGHSDLTDPVYENMSLQSSKWILTELARVNNRVIDEMSRYNMNIAFEEIYQFTWDIYCSWYLEIVKVQDTPENKQVARFVLGEILKLLHSFAPYVTEEIYQNFGFEGMLAQQLVTEKEIPQFEGDIMTAFALISGTREHRKALNLSFSDALQVQMNFAMSDEAQELAGKMGRVEFESVEAGISKPLPGGVAMISCDHEQKTAYVEKIQKQLADLEKAIKIDEGRLNSDFVNRAPEDLVQEARAQFARNKEAADVLRREIEIN